MTPAELANKAAEEVFRAIEREKRIVKADIAEAIEKVLLKETYSMVADVIAAGSIADVPEPKVGEWKVMPPGWPNAFDVRMAEGIRRAEAIRAGTYKPPEY